MSAFEKIPFFYFHHLQNGDNNTQPMQSLYSVIIQHLVQGIVLYICMPCLFSTFQTHANKWVGFDIKKLLNMNFSLVYFCVTIINNKDACVQKNV